MTRNSRLIMAVLATAVLLAAPAAQAQRGSDVAKEPVALKYIKMDKFGNSSGFKHPDAKKLCKECRAILQCKLGQKALAGKADPKYSQVLKDMTFWKKFGKKSYGFVLNHGCRGSDAIGFYGLVLWNVPGADKRLASIIKGKSRLTELVCGDKYKPYRALWWLNAQQHADVMIKGFENAMCTTQHTKQTLAVLHTWNLSKEQRKTIETFCVEKVFSGDMKDAKENVNPCLRYLGRTGVQDKDSLEYFQNYIGKGYKEAVYAMAAAQSKQYKGDLKGILSKQKKKTTKAGKKVTWYYARDLSVPAAIGLLGLGDGDAKKAVKQWLGWNKKWKSLYDNTGWQMLYSLAWTAKGKARKKLLPLLKKGFKMLKRHAKKDDKQKIYLLRAAMGLAHAGDKTGVSVIVDAIKGTNTELRDEAIATLGSKDNYYYSYRAMGGGLHIAKKGGLSKKDAQKIEKAVLKRLKFWSEKKLKQAGARIVLDIRARIAAAGL